MASEASAEPIVCGVDEAGRGPLAGPVFAAAVILDPARRIRGLADSKTLAEERRDALAEAIREHARAWSVASASVEEIDRLNIFHATMLAMRRAVEGLSVAPEEAWIDGNRCPPGLACRARAFVEGDARHAPISAASILAKTARDAQMRLLHERWPQYGFDRHKGYGTEDHLQSIGRHGPCEAHRRSFQPVGVFFRGDLFRDDWRALEEDARARTYRYFCEVARLCRQGGPRDRRLARLLEGERRLREDYADVLAATAPAPEVAEAERLLRSTREKLS